MLRHAVCRRGIPVRDRKPLATEDGRGELSCGHRMPERHTCPDGDFEPRGRRCAPLLGCFCTEGAVALLMGGCCAEGVLLQRRGEAAEKGEAAEEG